MNTHVRMLLSCAVAATLAQSVSAADHNDPGRVQSSELRPGFTTDDPGDPAADIADLFAFHTTQQTLVIILTWRTNTGFDLMLDPSVLYGIHVDANGNGDADFNIFTRYGKQANGSEGWGAQIRGLPGRASPLVLPVGAALDTVDLKVLTGLFDDPFVFDFDGFINGLSIGGISAKNQPTMPEWQPNGRPFSLDNRNDSFRGLNAHGIVLEMPFELLGIDGNKEVHVWSTSARHNGKHEDTDRLSQVEYIFIDGDPVADYTRIDAMGVALTSTALTNRENAYQLATPYILGEEIRSKSDLIKFWNIQPDYLLMFARYLESMHNWAHSDKALEANGFEVCTLGSAESMDAGAVPSGFVNLAEALGRMARCVLQETSEGGPRVIDIVVNDWITIDVNKSAGFPNGRLLSEQINDIIFAMGFLKMGGSCPGGPCTLHSLANWGLNQQGNDPEAVMPEGFPWLALPWKDTIPNALASERGTLVAHQSYWPSLEDVKDPFGVQ